MLSLLNLRHLFFKVTVSLFVFVVVNQFRLYAGHMVSDGDFSRKLGGLYCLYCLFGTQPYKPCFKIYLSLGMCSFFLFRSMFSALFNHLSPFMDYFMLIMFSVTMLYFVMQ